MAMSELKIASVPFAWGAFDFSPDRESPEHMQVLAGMKEAGYSGAELGDWGFLPASPMELREALKGFDLQLTGAFVPVALSDERAHRHGVDIALKSAGLMYDAGYEDAFIVLADQPGMNHERTNNAGRITEEMGLSDASWITFASGAEKVAREVRKQYGLRTVFHPLCGSFVETPNEVTRLMNLTDSSLLGLCLDTGHYAFGGGNPVEALQSFYDRICYVHFKDLDPKVDWRAASEDFDYFKSLEEGIFCELGKGSVDFKSIARMLKGKGYEGWIVVDQGVIPGMGSPKKCASNNRQFINGLGL